MGLNGDGKFEIIATNLQWTVVPLPRQRIWWILATSTHRLGMEVFSTIISPGNCNGDGKSDLLARGGDGTLWMYPGYGTGGFTARKAVGGTSALPSRAE
jgi:serine protease